MSIALAKKKEVSDSIKVIFPESEFKKDLMNMKKLPSKMQFPNGVVGTDRSIILTNYRINDISVQDSMFINVSLSDYYQKIEENGIIILRYSKTDVAKIIYTDGFSPSAYIQFLVLPDALRI